MKEPPDREKYILPFIGCLSFLVAIVVSIGIWTLLCYIAIKMWRNI